MIIQNICEWNAARENFEYKIELEFSMLQEELSEYIHAFAVTLQQKFGNDHTDEEVEELQPAITEYVQSKDGYLDIRTAEADALADIIFVATGALFKLAGGDTTKVVDILNAVQAANDLKSTEKNSEGKITKPKDFVGPEPIIRNVLAEGLN